MITLAVIFIIIVTAFYIGVIVGRTFIIKQILNILQKSTSNNDFAEKIYKDFKKYKKYPNSTCINDGCF